MDGSAQNTAALPSNYSRAEMGCEAVAFEPETRHVNNRNEASDMFCRHWRSSTADNNLTLHGFRRFKTTHLLNLRFLEQEIAELDHTIYQAGLSLDLELSAADRLGLNHCKRDINVGSNDENITQGFILKLRDLIKQYDESLCAFNGIMAMETFSLLDDEKQASQRTDLSLYEKYKTRLVRVDLRPRTAQDPFERRLHKLLRGFRFWSLSRKAQSVRDEEGRLGARRADHKWSYQNTIILAEAAGRFLVATATSLFLIVPLAILTNEVGKTIQLLVVSGFILVFSFLVSVTLRASNLEAMMVSAAYAAVLSVFVSNIPTAGT